MANFFSNRLVTLARGKHFSLLGPCISYEVNEVLAIGPLNSLQKWNLPSLFMPIVRHFLSLQAWHWFRWALSIMQLPVPAWHLEPFNLKGSTSFERQRLGRTTVGRHWIIKNACWSINGCVGRTLCWPNVCWQNVCWPNVCWPNVCWPNVCWLTVCWPTVCWPTVCWLPLGQALN